MDKLALAQVSDIGRYLYIIGAMGTHGYSGIDSGFVVLVNKRTKQCYVTRADEKGQLCELRLNVFVCRLTYTSM